MKKFPEWETEYQTSYDDGTISCYIYVKRDRVSFSHSTGFTLEPNEYPAIMVERINSLIKDKLADVALYEAARDKYVDLYMKKKYVK